MSLASHEYHLISRWRLEGSVDEVSSILSETETLTRWWPSVYLAVQQTSAGNSDGVGQTFRLHTRGWLPYTLNWTLRLTEPRSPQGFSLEATGDFDGRGIWAFQQDGPVVSIIYDWKIQADKPLLRFFSFLLKPVFSANHHWAMRRGEESLKLELVRRRCRTAEERAQVPNPPGPARSSSWIFGVSGASLLVALACWFW